jgi:hypothetical protein
MKIAAYIIGVLGILAALVVIGLLLTYPLMWAINYVFTTSVLLAVFGVPQITFWKTFLLSFVTGWLFKGNSTSSSK